MRFVGSIMVALLVYVLWKKRYRVLNMFLKRRWLRVLAVSWMMRIPFVREKMMFQTLH
ncbi:sodium:proton antiporter [Salipaludibacillus neizhouensis]|uniref:Sodium:proton antiporter n=1 Tax=Salipaludibacillus neizhouensis TaxID=885475 RepID=A0A3A9K875_9BACI|nr:sodium:proton antiporter [Salipaludibacillus neizhouensis]